MTNLLWQWSMFIGSLIVVTLVIGYVCTLIADAHYDRQERREREQNIKERYQQHE